MAKKISIYLFLRAAARVLRLQSIDLKLRQATQDRVPCFVKYVFNKSYSWPAGQCVFFKLWSLPFLILSLLLSAYVPRDKWSGFTHLGLSQLCITNMPSGIFRLLKNVQDNLCASQFFLPADSICLPYPFGCKAAFQFQQPSSSGISNLRKKLSEIFMTGCLA